MDQSNASNRNGRTRLIRITVSEEQAEALMWSKGSPIPDPDPHVLIGARNKIASALFRDPTYEAPWMRERIIKVDATNREDKKSI